jgi:hypothetical protein
MKTSHVHNIRDKTAGVILYTMSLLDKSETLTQSIIMKRIVVTSVGMAAVAVIFGAIQAQGQSVLYNFSDNTSDGWANSGFSPTPAAVVQTIGGQNYINIPLGGFQVANVQTGAAGNLPTFTATMAAAAANPAGYDISYNYYIDTSKFTGSTFLQVSTYVNENNSYYAQDPANEVSLNGTQLASGGIFSGTITINMAAVGFTGMSPTDTGYKLGLIENGNGTGMTVNFTDISVAPVAAPEPSSLALAGLGAISGLVLFRRRLA